MPAPHTNLLLPILALSSALAAQTTITNGTATYTRAALSTTQTPGTGDVLDGGSGNVLKQHGWWYRLPGDSREYMFRDDGTILQYNSGASLTTSWTDVDNRGFFFATLTQDVAPTAPGGAGLHETMIIGLPTPNLHAFSMELFCYTDFDIAGPGTDLAKGNNSRLVVIDQTNLLQAGLVVSGSSTGAAVASFPTIRNQLTDSAVDNFTTWSGAFGPGDYSSVIQWTVQFGAYQQIATVHLELASLGCRPDSSVYGTGGAGMPGVPGISSEYPVVGGYGTSYRIHLDNGNPNSPCALMLNLSPANQTLFGMNILVDPVGATNLIGVTNSSLGATVQLPLPVINPAFCGISFFGQWLVMDPVAVGGLAATSPGLRMTIGG